MKKIICLILSFALTISVVPALAADNTVKLAGEGIFIDNDTESTVWADKKGGTLVWDKEANTLTFNGFNYDFAQRVGDYGSGFLIRPKCSIILNGTSVITSSAKAIYTMSLNGAVISGDGKLTVYGANLEPEDTAKYFPVSWSAYSAAVNGTFTLNSGTLEAIGGTMKCDNKEDLYDFANSSTAAGVWCNGFDTIRINGGELIAKGGTTSGRKYYNESVGVSVGWGENNEGLVISGGRVTASGKDYGTSGKLTFPQYSEGFLYAVGEKSGIDCSNIGGEVIAYGSTELNADEKRVTGTLSRVCTSIRLSDDESSTNFKNYYEYTTGGAPAKTIVAWRNNERKLSITDLGAELSEEADSKVSYSLVTKNIKAEEIPQIEWTGDAPGGISAAFADEKLTFTSEGTAKRGVYTFKVAFGEGEKKVVSGEAALSVGSYAAKIICKNKPDEYFDTFFEALENAALSENAGGRLLLFAPVSNEEDITLDGDFTLDLNGYDVTCGALIIQNGAGVWGKGNIPVGKIGKSGRVGGGTYGLLLTTDGKTICDHLIEDTFCIQKEDRNDEGKYWYELSAVTSMENAVVHPVSFKIDPIADVETKAGYSEINVPIKLHETPYYEMTEFCIEKFIMINEDGSETKLDAYISYGSFYDSVYNSDSKTYERYSVKDVTRSGKITKDAFPGTGVYKVYAVISAYLDKKEVKLDWGTGTLLVEKYVTKTEPFEIRIGISKPTCVIPGDAVDEDGNVIMGWNIYSYYTYTGAPQQIVYSTPQVIGGTMMYRFNENEEWTEEVPTATEPGGYTFQCRIKGDDGYMDVPMRDGRAVINAAVLADNSSETSGSLIKDDKYFVRLSDALAEAMKKENEGKLLKLYYADKNGFALGGDTKIKLGLEHAAAVGEISLVGASQLTAKYGKFSNKITVDENAHLQIDDGEYSGIIDLLGGSASVSGGTVNQINLSNTAQLDVSGGTVKNLAANGKNARISGGIFENITVSGGSVSDLVADGYALQGSNGKLVNMYTSKISQTVSVVSHTHDLGDTGTCACGYESKAVDSDGDGFVEISNAEQLQWFAGRINSGKTLNAVLADDIDLSGKSVIIGTEKNSFKGKFDGKGKKITNYALAVSGNKQGLFGVVNGGAVGNFTISGTITIDGVYTHIGGAVGNAKGGAVISGIVSDVNISGSGAAKHVGGIVGSSESLGGSLMIKQCIYSGTINLPNVNDCVGGIMGYANNLVSILYCGFTGSVTGQKGGYVGGVLGYVNNSNFGGIKSSFAAGKTSGAALVGTVRDCSDSIKNCMYSAEMTPFGGWGASNHKATPVKEWNSGSAAYILNGGLYNNTYIWRQTIGKDAFPNFTGDMVYRNGKDSFTSEKPSAFVFFDGSTIVAEQIEQPCVLIAASYSGSRLIDVKIKDIKSNEEIALDEMNLNLQNADHVRAALWNSRESMTPICKMVQMSLN